MITTTKQQGALWVVGGPRNRFELMIGESVTFQIIDDRNNWKSIDILVHVIQFEDNKVWNIIGFLIQDTSNTRKRVKISFDTFRRQGILVTIN